MRLISIAVLSLAAASVGAAQPSKQAAKPGVVKPGVAKPAPAAAHVDAPLLPSSFAGWEASGEAAKLGDPAQADAANAAALKEYGFTEGLTQVYQRGGETLTLKALRFEDASGAYGAYSFYRHSGWPKVEIGTGGTSDNNRVLFWVGNVFVDAQFGHVTAMSAAELRELAKGLPVPSGNKALPPPVLGYLPQKNLDGQTTHYALGPAGYAGPAGGDAGVLPASVVGFDHGAEVATASYSLRSNAATLTVIDYPTPQIATAEEQAITAYLKGGDSAQHPFTKALKESNSASLEVRRSGPLVTVVSGDAIPDEAHKLIGLVHYEADTSSLPGVAINPVQNMAKLIIGIIALVLVMFVAALIAAVFLGGGRAAFRVMRGKPASSMYDEDFTRLDLKD
jgi:hypothetical protein